MEPALYCCIVLSPTRGESEILSFLKRTGYLLLLNGAGISPKVLNVCLFSARCVFKFCVAFAAEIFLRGLIIFCGGKACSLLAVSC